MRNYKDLKGINIYIVNLHGLIKGSGLEIGRDADNGGQTKYVYELAEHLSRHEKVEHVYLFTRKIDDPAVSKEYSADIEEINPKCSIRRIEFGGLDYLKKESLWEHLDEFVENALLHIKEHGITGDWIHSHYADAGYAARALSIKLNVPFAHTGHSLGIPKRQKLGAMGLTEEEGEERFKFKQRIEAEEKTLELSEFMVTSTYQEISNYEEYTKYPKAQFNVLPPGCDTDKFVPYYQDKVGSGEQEFEVMQRKYWVKENIEKFLSNPSKPVILAISRPDRRKNLHSLLELYGKNKELQALANLAIFAGIRKDIIEMEGAEKDVLTELLLLMDKYDLYGKLALPKKHDIENEVALIYQYSAEKRGVFVNLTLHENFGLTTIEAAATGLPVVITNNGGPSEIVPKCQNGYIVDPTNPFEATEAIKKILTNEDKWKSFSNKGVINAQKYFSWNSHVEVYLSWVEESLKHSRDKTPSVLNISKEKVAKYEKVDTLIITDIDGTLIEPKHENPGLDELKKYLENKPANVAFGLASGRNSRLIDEVITQFDLKPDFIVASVGSEIYYENTMDGKDGDWEKYLQFHWDRETMWNKLKEIPWLTPQEDEAQNEHKLSYYYDHASYDEEKIRALLGNSWYHVNVVPSHQKFLDILPKRGSKGNAIIYLCHKWGIPINKVYACGDSGNDLDMFRDPVNGIIVGNRSSELNHLKPRKNLYLAENFAAAGICEGLRYYGLDI